MKYTTACVALLIFAAAARAEERTIESIVDEKTGAMVRCAATYLAASGVSAIAGQDATAELLKRQSNGAKMAAAMTLTTATAIRTESDKNFFVQSMVKVEEQIEALSLTYAALEEVDFEAFSERLGADMAFCAQPAIRDYQARVVELIEREIH